MEGSLPPPSVSANWPRDLSTSIALHGSKAKPVISNIVRFEALAATSLVTRTVTLPVQQSIKLTVEDQPKSIVVSNIATPPETIEDGKTMTWNARIRVKK